MFEAFIRWSLLHTCLAHLDINKVFRETSINNQTSPIFSFLNIYKINGIDVWGVSSQNEPGDGYYVYFGINSCGYSPEEELNFIINNLGPTLRKNGFGNINIMAAEEQRPEIAYWTNNVSSINIFNTQPIFLSIQNHDLIIF